MSLNERRIVERALERHSRETVKRDLRKSDRVFVYEWRQDESSVVGVGPDERGIASYLPVIYCPGLYAVTCDPETLEVFCSVHAGTVVRFQKFEDRTYNTVNFHPHEILLSREKTKPGLLVKLETSTFEDAMELHRMLRYDETCHRFVNVSYYWDATKFIEFEFMNANGCWEIDDVATTFRWMGSDLRVDDPRASSEWFDVPVVSYDIETVSGDMLRVPYGDLPDDHIFTVSITHWNTKRQFSLLYLPLVAGSKEAERCEAFVRQGIAKRRLAHIEPSRHFVSIHYDEAALVRECFELSRPGRVRVNGELVERFHIITGWNTEKYDNKFMLLRAAYFGLDDVLERMVYCDGLSFGHAQKSFDLYLYTRTRLKLECYKLDYVANRILHERKRDVNAVALRFQFDYIERNQAPYISDEDQSAGKQREVGGTNLTYSRSEIPCLIDSIDYNDQDSLLVAVLFDRMDALRDISVVARTCISSVGSFNSKEKKTKMRVFNTCFSALLRHGSFLSCAETFVRHLMVPLPSHDPRVARDRTYNFACKTYNVMDHIQKPASAGKRSTKTKFGRDKLWIAGGLNFNFGHVIVRSTPTRQLEDLDFIQFLPTVIRDYNISEETVDFLPASFLLRALPFVRNSAEFRLFDYNTHAEEEKIFTQISIYNYIKNNVYAGEEFSFDAAELAKRGDSVVLVLYTGRQGLFSQACGIMISRREHSKREAAVLENLLTIIDELASRIADARLDDNENNDDNGNSQTTAVKNDHVTDIGDDDGSDGEEDAVVFSDSDNDDEATNAPTVAFRPWPRQFDFEKYPSNSFRISETGIVVYDDRAIVASRVDLQPLRRVVVEEMNRCRSMYLFYKEFVSSIYGNLSPQVRSAVTYLGRMLLIMTAKRLESMGCDVLYGDTDGVHIINPTSSDLASEINKSLEVGIIESHKVSASIFVRCKVHLDEDPETKRFKYNQHKNGPSAWRWIVDFVFDKKEVRWISDVDRVYNDLFATIYEKTLLLLGFDVDADAGSFTRVTVASSSNDLVGIRLADRENEEASGNHGSEPFTLDWFCRDVWVQEEYANNHPLADFKRFLARNYPEIRQSMKQRIFYEKRLDNIAAECVRPSFVLYADTSERGRLDALRRINLLVFALFVQKTMYYGLDAAVRTNSRPHEVALNENIVKLLCVRAFDRQYRKYLVTPFASDPALACAFY